MINLILLMVDIFFYNKVSEKKIAQIKDYIKNNSIILIVY